MILPKINRDQVINLRAGPSTGGKWIIDFQGYSRERSDEEAKIIWLDFLKNNKL